MPFQPILADWISTLGPLFVAIFLALRAYLEARAEKNRPERELKLPEPDVEVQDGQPAKPQQARQGPPPGSSDVDDFLRRLADEQQAERRERELPTRETQAAAEERPPRQRRPKQERPQQTRPQQTRPEQTRSEQTWSEAANADRGESVDEHVRQHMGRMKESQLAENAARLGQGIATSDDRMAARLQSKFDHRLGNLDKGDKAAAADAPDAIADGATAESLAKMLASPGGIRNAIILNEILHRPEERW